MGKTESLIGHSAASRIKAGRYLATSEDLNVFEKRGRIITPQLVVASKLAFQINLALCKPRADGRVSDLSGAEFENIAASMVGGEVVGENGGPYDVIKDDVGWEVKVLKNMGRDSFVLARYHKDDVMGRMSFEKAPAKKIARKLFAAVQRKHDEDVKRLGFRPDHKRFLFLGGMKSIKGKMSIWEEPYCLSDGLLDSLTWTKNNSSISGKLNGSTILSWYPRGGNLKFSPDIPGDAIALNTLEESLPKDDFMVHAESAFSGTITKQLELEARSREKS